ncbi:MAG: DUF885 domain-containing protein [Actinomycetia bacterium]|nr:DUF885 domain-containing protein [Actinomycetes bacterium]
MPDIFHVSSTALETIHELDPVLATFEGDYSNSSEWTDLSPDGFAAQREFWSTTRSASLAAAADGRDGELAKRVMVDEADLRLADLDRGWTVRDLNNIASPWQYIREVFHHCPAVTHDDWNALAARLETIDQPIDSYFASLEAGVAVGEVPARRQVEIAIEQGHDTAGDESSFDAISGFFDAAVAADPALESMRDRIDTAIVNAKAEFARGTTWLSERLLPVAPDNDALGRDRYVAAARVWLGADLDPVETYEWGWSEIARLREDLVVACDRVVAGGSVDEVLNLLMTDPTRAAADADEFLDLMQQRQEQALADLEGSHFDVDPRIRHVEVTAAPPGGAASPYYSAPSEDFSRPGRVWYPMEGRKSFPLYDEITTAYHEGFPGHHLQVGTQVTMGDRLSRFHRVAIWNPGSGEGWALYAERLMGELGYLDKPDYEVGLLMSQLMRACRIVIDIGCHLELPIPTSSPVASGGRWSYEVAVQMLTEVAHQTPHAARSEAVRYLGWPGQAISYKVGEQAILDLRDEWIAANGSGDLRRFHAEVLAIGSVGLDLTRSLVRATM